MNGPVVVIGDALLDRDLEGRVERLCPDAPVPVVDAEAEHLRPGGAGLAAALALSSPGPRPVVLVTALGQDDAGRALVGLLADLGVDVVDLGLDGLTPEKVRVRAEGRSLLRIDHGGAPSPVGAWSDAAAVALGSAAAVLVADYGRGFTSAPGLRQALGELGARVPVVWDPHPRGAVPVPGARLATPNRREAAALVPGIDGDGLAAHTARARRLTQRWESAAVAVTLGAGGALLAAGDDVPPLAVPTTRAEGGDPCGAGDRFAVTAATCLADGALPSEAVIAAVASASAFVAAGGAARALTGPSPSTSGLPAAAPAVGPAVGLAAAQALTAAVRVRHGTVVAAGGCFDLLHAGHVALLEAARALGDCLVICLNSDASVRGQKGDDRPYVGEDDRAAVLLALGCVDAVVIFDELTPIAVLDRLRPDVFAKGADYAVADLPEAPLLEAWGGQAVVVPYLGGRSTSRLAQEVVSRSAR